MPAAAAKKAKLSSTTHMRTRQQNACADRHRQSKQTCFSGSEGAEVEDTRKQRQLGFLIGFFFCLGQEICGAMSAPFLPSGGSDPQMTLTSAC